ncbi:MAG TPA: hypothetical protein VGI60_08935 [Chthoniobacterales bacterium]
MTKVTLAGTGLALEANTRYWLVATTDDLNAPDFMGVWQNSSLAIGAYQKPEEVQNWTGETGGWLAAEIRGTNP